MDGYGFPAGYRIVYPTPNIRPDLDLARSDFSCKFDVNYACMCRSRELVLDMDFLPDTGFGYPMPNIRPDPDLARSDFSCKSDVNYAFMCRSRELVRIWISCRIPDLDIRSLISGRIQI